MTIVFDDGGTLRFKVTARLLVFFDRHRIRTTREKGVHRWRCGDVITAAGDARFQSHTMLLSGMQVPKIGAFSYSHSVLDAWTPIGRYCSIAGDVELMGPQHAVDFVSSSEILYNGFGYFSDTFAERGAGHWRFYDHGQPGGLRIGNDVWIGQGVMLKPGISIGDGAVIGARALVVKDVAPYEIVGGVPARRIRLRFDEAIVAAFAALRWWEYAMPDLPPLPWNEPARFIPELQELVAAGEAKPFDSDLGSVREVLAGLGD